MFDLFKSAFLAFGIVLLSQFIMSESSSANTFPCVNGGELVDAYVMVNPTIEYMTLEEQDAENYLKEFNQLEPTSSHQADALHILTSPRVPFAVILFENNGDVCLRGRFATKQHIKILGQLVKGTSSTFEIIESDQHQTVSSIKKIE